MDLAFQRQQPCGTGVFRLLAQLPPVGLAAARRLLGPSLRVGVMKGCSKLCTRASSPEACWSAARCARLGLIQHMANRRSVGAEAEAPSWAVNIAAVSDAQISFDRRVLGHDAFAGYPASRYWTPTTVPQPVQSKKARPSLQHSCCACNLTG